MPITIDTYNYEEIYPAFKATTDEKETTARINCEFLNQLASAGVVLTGTQPINVADIGSGPCDTLVKYLTGVKFAPGFIVRATDYNVAYADERRGEAIGVLAAAKASGAVKIVDSSVRAGDSFAGRLLDLLAAPGAAPSRAAFQIAFASHFLYHSERADGVERLIGDVAQNILARDGICVLYHLAKVAQSFQDFRARYGLNSARAAHSNVPAVAIDDPPAKVDAVCAALKIPHRRFDFPTSLRFGPLDDRDWDSFRHPERYADLLARKPGAGEDLKRLMFMPQRAPLEFASDTSATGLGAFLDEIRGVLEANGGVLKLAETMQVFYRADAPAGLGERVARAMSSIRAA